MMFDLTGKVSIITGGNGGLGLSMARGLVKCGGAVAVWGRNEAKNAVATEELQTLGGDVTSFVCDVTDEEQIARAFEGTLERFEHVDACFANAGCGGFRGPSHRVGRKAWLDTIDLNLMGVVQTWAPVTQHLLGRKKGGKLIVTSSVAARLGAGGAAGYSTTKAATLGLVRALAVELGCAGIQVNALLPGYIETELSLQTSEDFQVACKRRSAIGRIGTLEDMEGIAVFLVSNHSDFMTGQSIVLDGGHTIYPM